MDDKLTRSYPANYDAHARSVPPDAYWEQVRRTVDGVPLADSQISLIVEAIAAGLCLAPTDVVLDLACGNGALSSRLFDKCAGLEGVDISPYLIDIARSHFARPPSYRFCAEDALSYLRRQRDTTAFTKALVYGAFQYLSREDAASALSVLNQRFPRVSTVFIGNLPDKSRLDRFYPEHTPSDAELNDHEARMGVWYHSAELEAIAHASGWHASVSYMPAEFNASRYRFDLTLARPQA